jgi:hypothetical protein
MGDAILGPRSPDLVSNVGAVIAVPWQATGRPCQKSGKITLLVLLPKSTVLPMVVFPCAKTLKSR